MKRIIAFLVLCVFLSGCGSQKAEQEYNSPEPSEITQENSAEESSEPEEGFNFDAEFSEYQEEQQEIQDEIESIANDTNLPMWSDTSPLFSETSDDNISQYNFSYTIQYQRDLPGQSFVGYTYSDLDIIEKNYMIFVKFHEWNTCIDRDVLMLMKVTEEQLQSILTADNSNGFIYSFTVTQVDYYDVGIYAEQAENEDDFYMAIYGVPQCLMIYGTCNEIYKFI